MITTQRSQRRSGSIPQAGVRAFDSSLQKTNIWLKDLMKEMGWPFKEDRGHVYRERAYALLRVSLHAIRDGLNASSAAHLGAQLPMIVRGFYYEGWKPVARPKTFRDQKVFFETMREQLGSANREFDVEHGFYAVLRVLNRHVSTGEIEKVRATMPKKLRMIWPQHTTLPH